MADTSTQMMLTSLSPPSLPRSEARTRLDERPTSFTIWQPLNPGGRSETATPQTTPWTAEPATLNSLVVPLSQSRASSEATAKSSDEEDSPLSGQGKQDSPTSATKSSTSLLPFSPRILIDPSPALLAMQSTPLTPGISPGRRKLSYYANHSPGSPEVYLPTGIKPDVYIPTGAPARPVFEAKPDLTPASYGPSREDVESLLERERVYEERRRLVERKNSTPLMRLSSLTSELSGSIKRTLIIGLGKRGFEPRVGVMEGKKSVVSRSKSLFGGDVGRKKSVFQWKAGAGMPWSGRRAYTLGGMRKMGRMEDILDLSDGRENQEEAVQRGESGHRRYSWEE